jgi:hypothetical protein
MLNSAADLYMLIFDYALEGKEIGHGVEGYYFGENGEHSLYDIGKAIGEAMVKLGLSKSAEPTTFTPEEEQKYFNVRSVARGGTWD